MSSPPPPEAVLALARAAAAEIQRLRAAGTAVAAKADGSPQTGADRAADALLRAGAMRLLPGVPVLAEESGWDGGGSASTFWCIDPLDGTREFAAGRDDYTVNIALVDAGAPVPGAVVAPASGRAWWGGVAWQGAWCDGQPCRSQGAADGVWRVVASRSHADEATAAWLRALGGHRRVAMGSSLKICAVADGSADLYPRTGPTMAWDTAAAHAVLTAAGGSLVGPDGRVLAYDACAPRNPPFLAVRSGIDPADLPALSPSG